MTSLKLKRRPGQSVQIGPDVTVTVVAIQQGAITIDIQAPSDWRITRTDTNTVDGATNGTTREPRHSRTSDR